MNWKEFLKPDWKKIGLTIFIVFIIATLFFVLGIRTAGQASESMEPAIKKGDMVFYQISPTSINVDDIIVVNVPPFEYPLIRRIINITDGRISTRGDRNPIKDPWNITAEQVLGKVSFSVPLVGYPFISPLLGESSFSFILQSNLIRLIFCYLLSCVITFAYNKFKKK